MNESISNPSKVRLKRSLVRPSTAIMKKSRFASLLVKARKRKDTVKRSNTNELLEDSTDVHVSTTVPKGTHAKEDMSSIHKPTSVTSQTLKSPNAATSNKRSRSSNYYKRSVRRKSEFG